MANCCKIKNRKIFRLLTENNLLQKTTLPGTSFCMFLADLRDNITKVFMVTYKNLFIGCQGINDSFPLVAFFLLQQFFVCRCIC